MRPAFEKLLCRTQHKWSVWDASDTENINRHCLRASCDASQQITYSDYLNFQFFYKLQMRDLERSRVAYERTQKLIGNTKTGQTIRFRRYSTF